MIDTEALRKKVIDLAIQGKLTQQLPEDGNANDLYAQIQEEKAKLIKEGKIKKEKSLPEVSDDEVPFEIPKNWKWVQLNDIGSWSAGATPSRKNKEYYSNGTIPWIKTGELNDGYIYDVEECITDKAFEESSVRLNPIGSVLIAMYGATIGKVGILGINATTNQACCACIPILIDNRFLFYFLKGNKDQFINSSHGGAQPNISKEIIVQSRFPLPPLAEQKRIVEILNDVLAQIDIIDALQQQYEFDREILKGKIIDAGIRGKLTEQLPEDGNAENLYAHIQEVKANLIKEGKIKKEKSLAEITPDEIPFEIPQNWKWVRWGDISERIQYGFNAPAKESGRIRMVRISDIQDGKVNWDSVPYCDIAETDIQEYLLHTNDILFARTGGTVGKSYLVTDVPEDSVYAGYLIRTSYSSLICAQYIKAFMDSELYWKQLQNGTIATAQPNCNGKTLSKMIVPLPPLDEQKRIAYKIEKILSLLDA